MFEELRKSVGDVVTIVVKKIVGRAKVGVEKYGTTMDRKDLTILDWLNHAQEESMDKTLYLEKLIQEFIEDPHKVDKMRINVPVDEIYKLLENVEYITSEFEMDYMVDGEIVDNPDQKLITWYEQAKKAQSRLKILSNYVSGT